MVSSVTCGCENCQANNRIGSLASSVGKFIGTGPGRGVALLFIILGVVNVTVALLGFTIRSVRRIDIELKDIEIKSE